MDNRRGGLRISHEGMLRLAARALALLLALVLVSGPVAAAAATYVSATLGDVKPEDMAKVAAPQPVQLLFQFKTKGAPNNAATKFLKAEVTKIVTESGYFSNVSETATPNGAILSVVIDNVVAPGDMAKAEGQGVKTGATLFIAGSNVTDNYVSTLEYISGPGATKITRTAKHAVITQLGMINKPPENAVKIGSMKDGIFTMTRQIILNPLNEIAKDPAFAGPPAAAAPATPQAPETPQAPAAPPSPADAAPPPAAAQPAPPQEPTATTPPNA